MKEKYGWSLAGTQVHMKFSLIWIFATRWFDGALLQIALVSSDMDACETVLHNLLCTRRKKMSDILNIKDHELLANEEGNISFVCMLIGLDLLLS